MSTSEKDAAQRLGEMATGHAVVTMLGLGHRLGLLEPLGARALTIDELAESTGTDPRYVQEWLTALVAGGIVTTTGERFRLDGAYAPLLTGPYASNTAPALDMVVRLGEGASEVGERFRDGLGVPAATFARRAGRMLGEPRRRLYDEQFVEGFLGVVPGLHERLRRGASVLDLGCGTGQTSRLVAQAFPRCQVLGVDLVEDVVAQARLESRDVAGLTFAVGDAAHQSGHFDVVLAVDVVHDLSRPAEALRAIHDALDDDGLFVMVDTAFSAEVTDHVDDPVATAAAATSVLYCLPVSLHDENGVGAGLGALWGHQRAESMLHAAGFSRVDRYAAPRPQNAVYVAVP